MKTIKGICNYFFLVALLLAVGYGISRVHGAFFRTLDDGFYRLRATAEAGEASSPVSGGEDIFPEESPGIPRQPSISEAALRLINDWAEKENALLVIYGQSRQLLFADTPHGRSLLRLKKTGDSDSGLYLSQQLMSDDYYVQAGQFLPRSVRYDIEGSADLSQIPQVYSGSQNYWLFPINRYEGELQGDYFTVLTDSSHFVDLRAILEQDGFKTDVSLSARATFSDFIVELKNNLYSYSSFLLLFLSLCLSFVLIYVSWWRGKSESERIRHLFGKSRRKTMGQVLLSALLLWGAASLIWALLFGNLWFYYSSGDKWEVCMASSVLFLLLCAISALTGGRAALKSKEG